MAINYTEKDNVDPKSKFPVGNLLHFPNLAEGTISSLQSIFIPKTNFFQNYTLKHIPFWDNSVELECNMCWYHGLLKFSSWKALIEFMESHSLRARKVKSLLQGHNYRAWSRKHIWLNSLALPPTPIHPHTFHPRVSYIFYLLVLFWAKITWDHKYCNTMGRKFLRHTISSLEDSTLKHFEFHHHYIKVKMFLCLLLLLVIFNPFPSLVLFPLWVKHFQVKSKLAILSHPQLKVFACLFVCSFPEIPELPSWLPPSLHLAACSPSL